MKIDQPTCTRRRFLELGIIAGVVTTCAPESWAQADVPTTPSTIIGPTTPSSGRSSGHGPHAPARSSVTRQGAGDPRSRADTESARRTLRGRASNFGRLMLPAATATPPTRITPRSTPTSKATAPMLTDREGRFRFTTIKPGPYPFDGGTRAPHLHFQVTGLAETRVHADVLRRRGAERPRSGPAVPPAPAPRAWVADLPARTAGRGPGHPARRWDIVLRRG
jgi:protocatechuate 3,4-dioxygenase beta subunit